MKKMEHLRIAMLGHKRIPSREGGVEIVVEELSTRMAKLGHKVTCFNRSGHHIGGKEFDSGNISDYQGVKIKKVFTIDKKGLAAMTSSFFAAVKASFGNYDIVHFHAEGSCAMIWIPKLFRKKCIVTIHGLDWQRSKWGGFATKYIKFGEKCAVKYADEIIVLSQSVKQYFLDNYKRETKFIPNGIEKMPVITAEKINKKWALEKDSYILYLGRVVPEKGIDYLIDAFKNLKTNKKLVIAGGGSDTETYVQQLTSRTKDDERIVFTGFVQGDIMYELYSNAYIYVLPSDLEGMPLSLLEAMSYGNCCVTSDISECAEVVEDKAVLFKQGDINDLKDKLQMLCDYEDVVAKYKTEAADFICRKYNWNDVVTQTLQLYEK